MHAAEPANLPPMDVAGRLVRLRERLDGAGVDGLVVTGRSNVRYLSGFSGSAGFVLVLPGRAVLVTDGRYATQASEQLEAAGVVADVAVAPAVGQGRLASDLVGRSAPRLGLEADHVTWSAQREMAADWFPACELVATSGLVEGLRRVKDVGELARLGAAAAVADAALVEARALLAERPTEAELALALDAEVRRRGASGPSFETIVAAGPDAAMPHHRPGRRRIEPGEPVVVDFGALVDGYHSDMTRTVWVGELRDEELRRAVQVVTESQAAGVAAVAAGVPAATVDQVCREVIAAAGWADRFVHGTGHGVGLDIHEAPAVASSSGDTLATGHVVTVEPGVYLPGVGGVRIEDTVVVTDDGCSPLTYAPKDRC